MHPYIQFVVANQHAQDLLDSAAKARLASQAAALNGHVSAVRRVQLVGGRLLANMGRSIRGAVGSLHPELPATRDAVLSHAGDRRDDPARHAF